MFKPILVGASFLLACGGAPVDHSGDIFYNPCAAVVVIPGAATTQPQHDGIAAALGLWRQVGVASLTLEPEGVEQRVPIHFKESLAAIHGVYEPSIGEVRVNSKMADRALDITIAHELGHALGLPHVPASERSSVMNPSNSSVAPTSDDQRQLQALWSCLRSP